MNDDMSVDPDEDQEAYDWYDVQSDRFKSQGSDANIVMQSKRGKLTFAISSR